MESFQLTKRKEKWLGKVSTRQKLRESSLFKLLKERKFSFRWLLVSTIELLISNHCLAIKLRCGYVMRTKIFGMVFIQEEINNILFEEW